MDGVAAEGVCVGKGEEKRCRGQCCPHFFAELAGQAFGQALAGVHEAAGQVERPLGRFAAAAHAEQLALRVQDNRHRGSGGIGVEREAALPAALAEGVVFGKIPAPAVGAEVEVG